MGWLENLGNSFNDTTKGVSAWWNDVPKEDSTQMFLKDTVFKGQLGFSSVETFSKDKVDSFLLKHFTERFKDTPPDKMPKSFSDEEKQNFVKELLGKNFDTAPPDAKKYLLDHVDNVLNDKFEEHWIKGAGRWVKDSAAPAVGGALGTVASLGPVGWVSEGLGWGAGVILEKTGAKDIPLLGSALKATADTGMYFNDKRTQASNAIYGFGKFVAENPGRAGSLAGQGALNALTSTGGFIWDTTRFLTYDCVGKGLVGNAVIGTWNAFQDKDNKVDYLGTGKWLRHSEWLNDNTQWIADRIRPLNPDGTENKNANYERVLLYGPQAVVEVGAVVVASAFTGGAAGAGWAAARGTSFAVRGAVLTGRTLNEVKKVEAIADGIQVMNKVFKAEEALEKARKALSLADDAKSILQAEKNVAKATENLAKVTEKVQNSKALVFEPNGFRSFPIKRVDELAHATNRVETLGATTQDFVQTNARALERLNNGTPSFLDWALRRNPAKLTETIAADAAKAQRVGAQISETTGVLRLPELSQSQHFLETTKIWAHKGARFTDPFRDGMVGKAFNAAGVGMTFGVGYAVDTANAQKEMAEGTAAGEAALKASGNDAESLKKQGQNQTDLINNYKNGEKPWFMQDKSPAQQQPAAQETAPAAPENVSPDFNRQGSQGADSTINGGQTNNFNIRSAPDVVIQLDPKVQEELQRIYQTPPPVTAAPGNGNNRP